MKKIFVAAAICALTAVTALSFAACGEGGSNPPGSETYTFEAEYAVLPTDGAGWSGGMGGVSPDLDGDFNASNGYFVVGMYKKGSSLTFKVDADKAVEDAKLVARFSNEDPAGLLNIDGKKSYTLTSEDYLIKVNGTAIDYNDITFNNIKTTNKFMDYTIAKGLSLKQGENTIELICNNDQSMGGTTLGTAPIVDCIKITTTASLTWEPNESQLPE